MSLGKALVGLAPVLLALSGCGGRSGPSSAAAPCPANARVTDHSAWVPREERGPKLIRIEGGEFEMGATNEPSSPDASPAHRVKVDTFFMDGTEVTAGQYAQCVEAGVCQSQTSVLWYQRIYEYPRSPKGDVGRFKMESASCNLSMKGHEDHPMNCVDWYQANRFCAWAFKRLPTEAEWEYAARGREGRRYPWGNEEPTPERANICGEECRAEMNRYGAVGWGRKQGWNDGYATTAPVQAFPLGRTPDALWGMAGNVAEWTASHYCGYAGEPCIEQSYAGRGNAWSSLSVEPNVNRWWSSPMVRGGLTGFRCAR